MAHDLYTSTPKTDHQTRDDCNSTMSALRDMPTQTCNDAYLAAIVFYMTNMKKYETTYADHTMEVDIESLKLKEAKNAKDKYEKSYKSYVALRKKMKKSESLVGDKDKGDIDKGTKTFSLVKSSHDLYASIAGNSSGIDILKSSLEFANTAMGAVSTISSGAKDAGSFIYAAGEFAAMAEPFLLAMGAALVSMQWIKSVMKEKYNACPCSHPYRQDGLLSAYCYKYSSCQQEFGSDWQAQGMDKGQGYCVKKCSSHGPCYFNNGFICKNHLNPVQGCAIWQRQTYPLEKKTRSWKHAIEAGDGKERTEIRQSPSYQSRSMGTYGIGTGTAFQPQQQFYEVTIKNPPPVACKWEDGHAKSARFTLA